MRNFSSPYPFVNLNHSAPFVNKKDDSPKDFLAFKYSFLFQSFSVFDGPGFPDDRHFDLPRVAQLMFDLAGNISAKHNRIGI